jgi:alternate signal-mediated exported protein
MNKMVKASVVGAAGVSLLMGGFGTYALWHDSAAADNSSVTSGVLDINANTATWQDVSATGPNSWTVGSPIVPGDKLKMTQTFDVKATGANMKGTLTFDPGAVNTTAFGGNLTVTPTATADVAFTSAGTNAWTFNAPLNGTKTVTATVVYDFSSATSQQQAQNAAASIGTSTFSVDQVRP